MYRVIYELIDDMRTSMEGLLEPVEVFIIGHDFGATVAYQFALCHQERILGIATLGVPFMTPRLHEDLKTLQYEAALLSLIPTQFLKISEVSKLTATALAPLVNWFHNNFGVTSPGGTERSFQSALALALEMEQTAGQLRKCKSGSSGVAKVTEQGESITFSDVAGIDEAKEELEEIVVCWKLLIFNNNTWHSFINFLLWKIICVM